MGKYTLIKTCITILAITGLLSSCKTKIEIEEKSLNAYSSPTLKYIYFDCSDKWRAWSSANWCVCANAKGEAGENSIKLIITQNFDNKPRQGLVVIESGNSKDTVVVTQKENTQDIVLLSPSTLVEKSDARSETISFYASQDWTIVSTEDWISLVTKKGSSGIQKVQAYIKQNPKYDNRRNGQIVIKTKKEQTIVFIDQNGKEIRNKDWSFYDWNAQNIPTRMARGSETYVFDNEHKQITYYENKRRIKEYIYAKKLDDPREWNMATKDLGLVKEYQYTVEGVLFRAKYTYGGNSKLYYAEVEIDASTGNEETYSWKIYQKNSGLFDDKVLTVERETHFSFFSETSYSYKIYLVNKSTGIKELITTLWSSEEVKDFVLDYLVKIQ